MGVLHLRYDLLWEVCQISHSVPGIDSDLQFYSETTTQGFVSISSPHPSVCLADDYDKMVTYLLATRVWAPFVPTSQY
jgi:hypothetical protein